MGGKCGAGEEKGGGEDILIGPSKKYTANISD
jgi:hypothetical protein